MRFIHTLLYRFKAFILNILTAVFNVFIRRDPSTWIVGSWMGTRFADNSRYFYQYLFENKEKYNIKTVVWITRNRSLLRELRSIGYKVEMANSLAGIFYHLRSGVHVVCNMPYSNGPYSGDINGFLSYGAKKVQLWHGFPIKANARGTTTVKSTRIKKSLAYRLSLPGMWSETQYVISTGAECSKRYIKWFQRDDLRMIECGYPRNCNCLKLLESEVSVMDRISHYKKSILYLPTFRSGTVDFDHPLADKEFAKLIVDNDILWIEKPHLASSMDSFFSQADNAIPDHLLRLDGAFDVNVLLPYVSLVVTDYSSVSVDAIYFDCPVIYYILDFKQYCGSDRGLTDGFDEVTKGPKIYYPSQMTEAVTEQLRKSREELSAEYETIKNIFFDGRKFSYEQQLKEIIDAIN